MSESLVQVLNLVVVGSCMVLKFPQMYKLVKDKTTQGLNMKSLLMEIWCFNILLAYPHANGYPLLGYLEFLLISVQNYILLLMIWKDRKQMTIFNLSAMVLFIAFIYALAYNQMPASFLYGCTVSVTPFSALGKSLQLWSILSTKDAGAVSSVTWFLATISSASRIITQTLTTGDLLLTFISCQATLLNCSICVSSVIYGGKNQRKKIE